MLRGHPVRRLALLFAIQIAAWLGGLILLARFSMGSYWLVTKEVGSIVVGVRIGLSGWQLFNRWHLAGVSHACAWVMGRATRHTCVE